ncbi:MAG: flagellar biosynthesis anti-sigma factor FlgM [Candidatus Sulfotelmatobacter sp.]
MRIDPNQTSQALSESGRSGSQSPASASTRAGGNGLDSPLGEDQASLSGGHAQVQGLAAQVLQFPEVRQEKIDALRQAVNSGSYQPGADKIAGAVFNHLLAAPAA